MRSAVIAAAAFAATAFAVPHQKREVYTHTDVDVAYVTQVVTVTQGAQVAAETPAAEPKKHFNGWSWPSKQHKQHKQHNHKHGHPHKPKTTQQAQPQPEPTTYAPAPTTSQPAPAGSAPDSYPTSGDYQPVVIAQHNVHRANHSAPDLTWDAGLAATAQKIAESCVYAHNTDMDGGGYGQNIAAGVDNANVGQVITNMFYNNEITQFGDQYGEDQPDMTGFEAWGHFTQIVWKSTKTVGCFTQHCPGGLGNTGSNVPPYFTVCNYGPPGNYANEYGANVLQPKGEPSVVIS